MNNVLLPSPTMGETNSAHETNMKAARKHEPPILTENYTFQNPMFESPPSDIESNDYLRITRKTSYLPQR